MKIKPCDTLRVWDIRPIVWDWCSLISNVNRLFKLFFISINRLCVNSAFCVKSRGSV